MTESTHTGEEMVPVLYCDIDGTIRWGADELGHFVNEAKDVRVFDGVADLLWRYKRMGYRIVGISNQGGVALGYMTMAVCLETMAETQRQTKFAFDKIVWCSHHPDAKDLEMAVCWCRKPKAGLVVEAALAMSEQTGEMYPPHLGLFVGDRPEDEECAKNAGLRFMAASEWRNGVHAFHTGRALDEARKKEEIRVTVEPTTEIGLMSVDEARQALGFTTSLTEEELNAAVKITGAKVKTVQVKDLEVGAEFVYEGALYTVTKKDDVVVGTVSEEGVTTLTLIFWNPDIENFDAGTDLLFWNTEVLTDA